MYRTQTQRVELSTFQQDQQAWIDPLTTPYLRHTDTSLIFLGYYNWKTRQELRFILPIKFLKKNGGSEGEASF